MSPGFLSSSCPGGPWANVELKFTPLLQAPQATPVRKPIVLKKIVAHTVEVRTERGVVGGEPEVGSTSVDVIN